MYNQCMKGYLVFSNDQFSPALSLLPDDRAFSASASPFLCFCLRLSLNSTLVLEKREEEFISIQIRTCEQKRTCANLLKLQIYLVFSIFQQFPILSLPRG